MTQDEIYRDIETLTAEADKLRLLHEDDPAQIPLGALVDKINALRALQDPNHIPTKAPEGTVEGDNAPEEVKRGRPRKVV